MTPKKHICRFNDGDQVCDCYDEGFARGQKSAPKKGESYRLGYQQGVKEGRAEMLEGHTFKPKMHNKLFLVQITNPQSPRYGTYKGSWSLGKRKVHYSLDGKKSLCNQIVAGKIEDNYGHYENYGVCKICEGKSLKEENK